MKHLSNIVLPVISVALFFTLISCTKKQPPLHFAYQDRVVDLLSYLTIRNETFKTKGLDVKTSLFSSGPACVDALVFGGADVATMGDTAALILLSRFPGKYTILGSHGGGEARHKIIIPKESLNTSPVDLSNKKIGVKKGTSTHAGLMKYLSKNNVTTFTLVDLDPTLLAEALASKEVDAVAASEPTPSQIVLKEKGRVLADFSGLGSTWPVLLVTKNRFLETHKSDVTKFISAFLESEKQLKENPQLSYLLTNTGLSIKLIDETTASHQYKFHPLSEIKDSLNETAEFLKQENIIETIPVFESPNI